MYVDDLRDQFEKGHITFGELDKARDLAKKLIEERFQEKEDK